MELLDHLWAACEWKALVRLAKATKGGLMLSCSVMLRDRHHNNCLQFYCEKNLELLLACDVGMSQPCFGQELVTMQTEAECGKLKPRGQCKHELNIMSLGSTSNRITPKHARQVYCDII